MMISTTFPLQQSKCDYLSLRRKQEKLWYNDFFPNRDHMKMFCLWIKEKASASVSGFVTKNKSQKAMVTGCTFTKLFFSHNNFRMNSLPAVDKRDVTGNLQKPSLDKVTGETWCSVWRDENESLGEDGKNFRVMDVGWISEAGGGDADGNPNA